LKNGDRQLGAYVQESGALDSLVKNPLDWISRSRSAGDRLARTKSPFGAITGGENSAEFLSRRSVVRSTVGQRQKRKTGRIFGFFWSGKAIDQKGADNSGGWKDGHADVS
jgi:hypothetical protein